MTEEGYIRDETLRSANNILIDHHYDLPLSHLWGGRMLSQYVNRLGQVYLIARR